MENIIKIFTCLLCVLIGATATLVVVASDKQTEVEQCEQEVAESDMDVQAEAKPVFTDDELEILALIIYQEAGADYCSDATRQMVGEVVLNRVNSPMFPDTMYEVATQKAQYGRLSKTGIVWPDRAHTEEELHAVLRAYNIAEDLLNDSVVRYLPSDTIYQAEFKQGTEVLVQADGFYFCR